MTDHKFLYEGVMGHFVVDVDLFVYVKLSNRVVVFLGSPTVWAETFRSLVLSFWFGSGKKYHLASDRTNKNNENLKKIFIHSKV